MRQEIESIKARYARRVAEGKDLVYNPLNASDAFWAAEKRIQTAALLNGWLRASRKLRDCAIIEIGCGSGGNLLDMICLGADPARLLANELLPERMEVARCNLPQAVTFLPGDVMEADIPAASIDLALQFTVLSSVLDLDMRRALAARLWSWLKPGGAILSYDFVYSNPSNPDVRKVSVAELRSLFPEGAFSVRRVTLAPPLARRVAKFGALPLHILNAVPFLRSHALCLIEKTNSS